MKPSEEARENARRLRALPPDPLARITPEAWDALAEIAERQEQRESELAAYPMCPCGEALAAVDGQCANCLRDPDGQLRALAAGGDPVALALLNAPEDDEP